MTNVRGCFPTNSLGLSTLNRIPASSGIGKLRAPGETMTDTIVWLRSLLPHTSQLLLARAFE